MTRTVLMALLGISVAAPMVLTGCGTVAGVGQDIAATGRAVENVATSNSPPTTVYYCNNYYYDQWGNRHCY